MCGICGLAYRDPRKRPDADVLRRMAATIRHRGPDDEGVEVQGQVGLGFRRLSIIDLSPAGHQPMSNEDASIWIIFNGEIYNFQSLRSELEGRHRFRSHTDTEVLVHLYEERGERMVEALEGMFAFAILDTKRERLLLARDPFGIKPLYYALDDQRLVFGSEIKPLLASGEVSREIDPAALNDYFDFLWIPAPRSIFLGVRKLLPAHTMELDLRTWQARFHRYWKPVYQPVSGRTLDDWSDEVQAELDRSVRAQMVADVPVGTFLSGGIDSTLVSRGAAHAADEPLRTFTIDFANEQFSEKPFAAQVAKTIGANATVRRTEPEAIDDLPRIVEFYDEPFADSSLLPTFAVSRVTREYVTVALSGDGGDELFSGYQHHRLAHQLSRLDAVPGWLARLLFGAITGLAPAKTRAHQWGRRLSLPPDLRRLTTSWLPGRGYRASVLSPDLRQNGESRYWHANEYLDELVGLPPVTQVQMYDLLLYLPNDMLVKVDRASMAHSLEVRVPFLVPRVAELAFRIPEEIRFKPGGEKRVLRHLVARHFGDELAYREKKGFGIPLRSWMTKFARGPQAARLETSQAVQAGVLDGQGVRTLLDDVRAERSRWHVDRSEELFAMIVFTNWWDRFAA
jgi:asparagine synthase (glutamine-hydrolysing)